MAEFEVTGLTYHIGAGLSKEDAKVAVRKFFEGLKEGVTAGRFFCYNN